MKNKIFYIFITGDYQSFISQNLEVVDLLGETFDFLISLGIQIEVDFQKANIRNKTKWTYTQFDFRKQVIYSTVG